MFDKEEGGAYGQAGDDQQAEYDALTGKGQTLP
jgi:hypothetical protein